MLGGGVSFTAAPMQAAKENELSPHLNVNRVFTLCRIRIGLPGLMRKSLGGSVKKKREKRLRKGKNGWCGQQQQHSLSRRRCRDARESPPFKHIGLIIRNVLINVVSSAPFKTDVSGVCSERRLNVQ